MVLPSAPPALGAGRVVLVLAAAFVCGALAGAASLTSAGGGAPRAPAPLAGPAVRAAASARPAVPFAPLIREAAARYGLDARLLAGLIEHESRFAPGARSAAGAVGLTQLMPATARALGVRDRTRPRQSVMGGARLLAGLLRRFGGDRRLALAAYNAGEGAVAAAGGVPPYPETRAYVVAVLAAAKRYGGGRLSA